MTTATPKALQVMAPNRKIFALKRIKLEGADREAAAGFIDEISLLQRLRGRRNIIQLIDAEVKITASVSTVRIAQLISVQASLEPAPD